MKRKTATVSRYCTTPSETPWKSRRSSNGDSAPPMVRLRGYWLEREGFAEGQKYQVDALLGTLTLTLADRPRKECPPEEAQVLLGGIVRRLAELRTLLEEIRDGLPRSPEEDRMLEAEIPSDLATELYGTIECVLDDDIGPAIEELTEASNLTAANLARQFEERRAEKSARKRLFAAVAPRVAEILDGEEKKPPPRRRPPRRPKTH